MSGANPFATRFTRPGRLPPLDSAARPIDVEHVLAGLPRCGTTAIIGPHGSGKSTVLTHLVTALEHRGEPVAWHRLRSWRDVPRLLLIVATAAPAATLCIDSWECAGAVAGGLARLLARVRGCRLVVTSHRAAGLAVLVDCRPTPAVLEALVAHLPDHEAWYGQTIRAADIRDAFARHRGDIREALFDLYDRFEARRGRPRTVRI